MQNLIVMTIIGKDRTGLVETLARLIAHNHGSWLESRMCRLGGEFAGILRVEVPEDKEQTLTQALKELQVQGLTVTIRTDKKIVSTGPAKSASFTLVGQDRPGIIYQISSALARHNINFEELESRQFSAAMSGEMIFTATARLQIPESCVLAELRRELEEIGAELMVDISFSES